MPKKTAAKSDSPKTADSKAINSQEVPNLIAENTKFEIAIPWKTVEVSWKQSLLDAQKEVKRDGFRQGHVPLQVIEQTVDRQWLVQRTVDLIIPKAYQDAVTAKKLSPITEPDIHAHALDHGKDWEFEVAIAEKPIIDITGYEKIVADTKKTTAPFNELAKPATKAKTDKDTKDAKPVPELTEEQKKDLQVSAIVTALLQKIQVKVPELLLRKETEYQLHRLEHELEHLQMTVPEFLERSKKTIEELQQEYAARALGNLQVELLLGEIVNSKKLSVEPKEVAEALKNRYPTEPGKAPVRITPDDVTAVQSVLLKKKALDHLLNL